MGMFYLVLFCKILITNGCGIVFGRQGPEVRIFSPRPKFLSYFPSVSANSLEYCPRPAAAANFHRCAHRSMSEIRRPLSENGTARIPRFFHICDSGQYCLQLHIRERSQLFDARIKLVLDGLVVAKDYPVTSQVVI